MSNKNKRINAKTHAETNPLVTTSADICVNMPATPREAVHAHRRRPDKRRAQRAARQGGGRGRGGGGVERREKGGVRMCAQAVCRATAPSYIDASLARCAGRSPRGRAAPRSPPRFPPWSRRSRSPPAVACAIVSRDPSRWATVPESSGCASLILMLTSARLARPPEGLFPEYCPGTCVDKCLCVCFCAEASLC